MSKVFAVWASDLERIVGPYWTTDRRRARRLARRSGVKFRTLRGDKCRSYGSREVHADPSAWVTDVTVGPSALHGDGRG